MRRRQDHEQLAYASSTRRVMYTANRDDFLLLHAQAIAAGRQHAGRILLQRERYSIGEEIWRIVRMQAALSQADFVDRLEWLSA